MQYHAELKPKAIKDLKHLPNEEVARIVDRLKLLENNLEGDVKRLTNYTPDTECGLEIIVFYLKLKMTK